MSKDKWKNAPSWADKVGTLEGESVFYNKESYQFCRADNDKYDIIGNEYTIDYFSMDESRLINNKEAVMSKDIYTQAQADAGELPSAGMECLYSNRCDAHPKHERCTIEYIGDLYCVIVLPDNRQGCSRIANYSFKPITPPIELEDGEAYQFDYINKPRKGFYDSCGGGMMVFLGGWCSPSNATNIKTLTV
jgi:hypothetical protein